jgi:Fur family transcriptional regulator, iron response regulator
MKQHHIIDKLKDHGLRPTKQRLALASLIFTEQQRHINADTLHHESLQAGYRISLATVYNTLNHFKHLNLLSEVYIDQNCSYFDTNTQPHLHLYNQSTGELSDIEIDPKLDIWNQYIPNHLEIIGMNVVIHVKS